MAKARKVSLPLRKGGVQMGMLAIIVAVLSLFIALLAYYYYKPIDGKKKTENLTSVSSERPKVTLTAEQKRLIQAEKRRRLAEEEVKFKEQQELEKQLRIEENLESVTSAITDRKWVVVEVLMEELLNDGYPKLDLLALEEQMTQVKLKEEEDIRSVEDILKSVKLMDKGKFSPEAIVMLDEALEIYPNYEPTVTLKNKINGYPYSIRVPEDVASLNEAAEKLRKGDTLILGSGKHKLTAVLDKGIQIKGQGQKLTSIQCVTRDGAAFALTGDDEVYKISDLTVEGLSYIDDALERYPLILVKSNVTIENVTVMNGSGHGVAVIGGNLKMMNCKVAGNAWDGVSVIGKASSAEILDSEITGNYEHGVDFWKGAKGKLVNLKVFENIASGVVVMGQGTTVKLEQVQTMRNRHSGILINTQAEVSLDRVFSSENVLSGIVIQDQGTKVHCGITVSNNNMEAGFFISPSAIIENFLVTTSEGNKGGNVIRAELRNPQVDSIDR